MASDDCIYYSDGKDIWPSAAGCIYAQPPATAVSNWKVCPLCSVWYLAGTVHNCTSSTAIPPLREAARIPYKCPCCDGYGEREKRGPLATDSGTFPCVSCGGRGIVF